MSRDDGPDVPRTVTLVLSSFCRGTGTTADRMRTVMRLSTLDGKLVAEKDPCDDSSSRFEWLFPEARR